VVQLDQRVRYIFLPQVPAALLLKPALYVELKRRVDVPLLTSKFRNVTPLGTLSRQDGSESGAIYELYLVSDPPKPPI
jgi:hypothetical protein